MLCSKAFKKIEEIGVFGGQILWYHTKFSNISCASISLDFVPNKIDGHSAVSRL